MARAPRTAIALYASLIIFSSVAVAEHWAVFRPEGVGYSLEMPGEWNVSERQLPSAVVGTLTAHLASVSVDDHVYMTMYAGYPPGEIEKRPVTVLLDAARDGAVKKLNGSRLRSEQNLRINNLPARTIIIDAEGTVTILRFFILKNTFIQALVIGPPGVETEADTKRFLDSLQVVPN